MKPWMRFTILLALVAAGFLVVWLSPLRRYADPAKAREAVEGLSDRPATLPIFVGVYAALTLIAFPGSVLTMLSGALFGLPLGILATNIGSTAGAAAAFWIGRALGREWIEQRFGAGERFARLRRDLETRGFLRVLQLRLIPLVPFNLLNFGCGLTRVRFLPYVLATAVGTLPGTAIYVYVGYSASRLWLGQGPDRRLLVLHVVVSLVLLAAVTAVPVLARRLRKETSHEADPDRTRDAGGGVP